MVWVFFVFCFDNFVQICDLTSPKFDNRNDWLIRRCHRSRGIRPCFAAPLGSRYPCKSLGESQKEKQQAGWELSLEIVSISHVDLLNLLWFLWVPVEGSLARLRQCNDQVDRYVGNCDSICCIFTMASDSRSNALSGLISAKHSIQLIQ